MQDVAEDEQAFLPQSTPNYRHLPYHYQFPWSRQLVSVVKTRKLLLVTILFVVSLLVVASRRGLTEANAHIKSQPNAVPSLNPFLSQPKPIDLLGPGEHVLGPPTERFRDNLRPDRKYITSWISAGWTNDVMTYMNLIYLALITERIPIIPMFIPLHIGKAPPMDFGTVFDVPRLRTALGKPVLEWHEVKNRSSEITEELGCWAVYPVLQFNDPNPRGSGVLSHLKLDISYTKTPTWVKLISFYQHDLFTTFWSLALFAYPEGRATNLVPPLESPQNHVLLPPDEHLLCYDYLYYVCANQPMEFEFDYSPAWNVVGRHVHFTAEIEELTHYYVRKTLGIDEGNETPPWIAIHIRHGDFKDYCSDGTTGCLPSLPVIARRVDEVKAELRERKGMEVHHVIMTSDEKDATWWDEVKARGWYQVDHSEIVEKYGVWYPLFIDAAIQGLGQGFVGTDRSTMSIIARRRVQSWSDGAVRIAKWGTEGADDH